MNALPFKLLNEPELVRIGSIARQLIEGWRQNWFVWEGEIDVRAIPAAEREHAPEAAPLIRALDESRWVAVEAGSGAYSALEAFIAKQAGHTDRSAGPVTALLEEVITECLTALCDEMLSAVAEGASKIEIKKSIVSLADARRHGSGAAAILLNVAGEQCALVLSGGLVRQILGPSGRSARGGLVTRGESIQGQRFSVRVVAGEAELSVGTLSSISEGDVILLDADLDALFTLTTPAGDPIGQGHLGAMDGRKALQLSS